MRRCFSARPLQALTALCASRTAATTTTSAVANTKLGVAARKEDVAKSTGIPLAILDKAANPRVIAYSEIELVRNKYAALISSVDASTHFLQIERVVREKYAKDASKLKPVPGAFKKFRETSWKDMTSVITFYEETMYPIRMKYGEYCDHQLSNYHIKDVLKRGLAAFKQDYLDAQKEEQKGVMAKMDECLKFIDVATKDAFDTALCNDIVNILRVAGEQHEHAHSMALKVMDDMNMMRIPYDNVTREIMKSVVFHDGPFDDSGLLFEVIEYPERGEISLSQGSLEKVSDEILKLISNRHQTPLDDGVLLRSKETHPNLQRSVE